MNKYLDEIQLNELKENGFLLIKEVFTEDEVEKLQSYCQQSCSLVSFEKSIPGDIFDDETLRPILFKKKIIKLLHEILGEPPVYFRDSQIHCKPNERVFHSDSRADYLNPRKSDYPIYRLGVFMQDHSNHSGGIKFRKNSHRRLIFNKLNIKNLFTGKGFHKDPIVYLNFGKIENAKAKLGDIVIWSLRTEHSGGAVIPKFFTNLAVIPKFDNFIPNFLKLPEHKNRMSIFYAFGKDGPQLKSYLEYKKNNINDEEHRQSLSSDVSSLKNLAAELGFKFIY